MMDRTPERRPTRRRRSMVTSVLLLTGLALAACTAETSTPATTTTADNITDCTDPAVIEATQELLATIETHDGSPYNGVSGYNTIFEGQDWHIGSSWRAGDQFSWIKDAPKVDDLTHYVLKSNDTIRVNHNPHESQYGGVIFKPEEYDPEPLCDPAQIDHLRAIVATLPEEEVWPPLSIP